MLFLYRKERICDLEDRSILVWDSTLKSPKIIGYMLSDRACWVYLITDYCVLYWSKELVEDK